MQGCRLGLVAVLMICFTAPPLGAAESVAVAQGRTYSIPEPEFIGQSEPAPEWIVWRAFHRSLHFYVVQSPDLVSKLLTSRLGIGEDAAIRFMSLGKEYEQKSVRLEADVSSETARRLGTHSMPSEVRVAAKAAQAGVTKRRSPTPEERTREQSRGPRMSIQNVLEQNGLAADFDARRMQVLQAHQREMLNLLGKRGYARLLGWIDAEVRDKVRVSHAGVRLATP